jgi:hypothetical protein
LICRKIDDIWLQTLHKAETQFNDTKLLDQTVWENLFGAQDNWESERSKLEGVGEYTQHFPSFTTQPAKQLVVSWSCFKYLSHDEESL